MVLNTLTIPASRLTPRPPARRLSAIALIMALAMLTVPSGIGAAATSGSVSVKTKGEYAKRSVTFCAKRRRIRFFHSRSTIEYRGFLIPATGRHFRVEIEVKRCTHRRFVVVDRYHFSGKASGKFKGFFHAPRVSHSRHFHAFYFYARAIVNGQRSAKTYFAVTR